MISQLKKLGQKLLRLSEAQLDWMDHRAEARRRATLKDHRTLEICMAGCLFLLTWSWWSGSLAVVGRPVCALAIVVASLKLIQLAFIALHQSGDRGHE
jgi:hypothetical protein